MSSANMNYAGIKRLLIGFIACGCVACAGAHHPSFPLSGEDRDVIAARKDATGLLGYIEQSSVRSQTREKKYQLLRLARYLVAADADSARSELALARCAYLVADIEPSADRQVDVGEVGERAALAAGAMKTSMEASYYYALNLGLVMRHQGLAALVKLDDLKKALDHCREETALDFGGPQRVLGMLYLKAPAWPRGIGDIDAALELLAGAVAAYPAFPQNRLFYAEALFSDARFTEARSQLEQAMADLGPAQWGPDYTVLWADEIRALLEKINKGAGKNRDAAN